MDVLLPGQPTRLPERIVARPRYMNQIQAFIDKPVIKILTGVRRCGKSTLAQMIASEIQATHPDAPVVHLNLESPEGLVIRDAAALLSFINQQAPDRKQHTYFFFDEIQQVSGWEEVINAIRVGWDCDIYLTGSNSRMLSGSLATNLAGRYVQFHVQTLGFAEFVDLYADSGHSVDDLFQLYLTFGGYPTLKYFDFGRSQCLQYLNSVYDSTVLKDVVEYHAIRDVDAFRRVVLFLLGNTGHTFSAQSLSRFFKSEGRPLSVDTIVNYCNFCVDAFLFTRVPAISLDVPSGKSVMRVNEKYYVSDHGLREAQGISNQADIQLVLENIVCQELISRGFNVSVGRLGTQEIDFVATRDTDTHYFQVTYLLADPATVQREFGALTAIPDNFPKTVLSMDRLDFSQNGIQHRNIQDWLLDVADL